jgi:hypothetical protein
MEPLVELEKRIEQIFSQTYEFIYITLLFSAFDIKLSFDRRST